MTVIINRHTIGYIIIVIIIKTEEDDKMKLMKRNGNSDLLPSFFDNAWFRDLFDRADWNEGPALSRMPAVNIREEKDNYEVELAAPGMKKDDFTVEVENNVLTISAENKSEQEDKNENYSRKEFSYTSFTRRFVLPENVVDTDKVKATYKDGVLALSIPKKEEAKAKASKRISIN